MLHRSAYSLSQPIRAKNKNLCLFTHLTIKTCPKLSSSSPESSLTHHISFNSLEKKMSAEAENIPTNVASGDAEAAVTAKGAKAKKTKEVKPKKKATKKKASSSPPSHPKYEEVREIRLSDLSFNQFQIRNLFLTFCCLNRCR